MIRVHKISKKSVPVGKTNIPAGAILGTIEFPLATLVAYFARIKRLKSHPVAANTAALPKTEFLNPIPDSGYGLTEHGDFVEGGEYLFDTNLTLVKKEVKEPKASKVSKEKSE